MKLRSKDMIHSFGVPEFRVKQDTIRGLTIPIWFVPTITADEMWTQKGNPEFQTAAGWSSASSKGRASV